MYARKTHVSGPFVLVAFPACSLVAFQPALFSDVCILFDEPHRVLVVDGQPEPHRIRSTTQLVNLGSGYNDAIMYIRWRPELVAEEFQIRFRRLFLHISISPPTTMSLLEPASVSPLPQGITDPNYKPLPGRIGNLTPGQQHALNTLRQQLVAGGHFVPERMDDATLLRYVRWVPCTLTFVHVAIDVDERRSVHASRKRPIAHFPLPMLHRFLRARKFDVAKTKTMLLSAEQWRKDFNVEEIVE